MLWPLLLRPATAVANRLCITAARRLGLQVESPHFSPYLYAIAHDLPGERRPGTGSISSKRDTS